MLLAYSIMKQKKDGLFFHVIQFATKKGSQQLGKPYYSPHLN